MCRCAACGKILQLTDGRRVYVAMDEELRSTSYISDLRRLVASEPLARRDYRDAIADSICRLYHSGGMIVGQNGREWQIPLVDDVFPKDPDDRWLSNFAKAPPHSAAARVHTGSLERIRLIDLYFRIEKPDRIILMQKRMNVANDK